MGKTTNDRDKDTVAEGVRVDHLLPDEDLRDYLTFRQELVDELEPKTSRQRLVAQNIVDIEWDIRRHRRFIAGVIKIEFCRQVDASTGGSVRDIEATPIVRSDLGKLLLRGDAASHRTIATYRVTTEELTAATIMVRGEMIAYHESRIADLERRRRSMMADYDLLTSRSTPTKVTSSMEDAEVIE